MGRQLENYSGVIRINSAINMSSMETYMKESGVMVSKLGFWSEEYKRFRDWWQQFSPSLLDLFLVFLMFPNTVFVINDIYIRYRIILKSNELLYLLQIVS